jgi:APA family basic amino acid/polyamine antiporter
LRKKRPEADRPYKAFGYPWLAGLYLFTGSAFCSFLIINKPIYAGGGLIITLVGIPLYYWAVGNKK